MLMRTRTFRFGIEALLKPVLQFRGMAFPRQCKPLVIPLLAHPGFKQAVIGFLREQIKNCRDHLAPFHLPSTQVVAGKTESIKDVLYNRLYMPRSRSWTAPPQCTCGALLAKHSDLQVVQGHVASPARLLNISRRLRNILRLFSGVSGPTTSCILKTMDEPERT